MKNYIKIIFIITVCVLIICRNAKALDNKIQVEYYQAIDGDTAKFKLNGKIVTVRLLGINTPEVTGPYREEEPYGKEASSYTKEKLKNASIIEIEYDENANQKDKYERHLAWVWIDGILLQEELMKEGLATSYMLKNDYKYAEKIKLAEENAKSNKYGIWSENINDETIDTKNYEDIDIIYNSIIILIPIFFAGVLLLIKKIKRH